MSRFTPAIALAAIVAGGLATSANAVVLFAEDFEGETFGAPSTLTNFDVTAGSIDVIGTMFFEFYGPGKYIDMNGTPSGPATIETVSSFNVNAGQKYTLSFDYGNNKNSNGIEQLTFGLGSFVGMLDIPGAVANLTNYTVDFLAAASGSFKLTFADTGPSTGDAGGPILDNVVLSTVPLPAGGLLLVGALFGASALRRRKNV